jgi:hypothetical protein
MMIVKLKDVRRVDLTAAAEAGLAAAALAVGGYVVEPDQAALEQLMVSTVALLAEIDDALTLPPIIQDTGRRAN